MKRTKYYVLILAALWAVLTLGLWFGPREAASQAERRPLAQAPAVTFQGVFSGRFMEAFEDFSLDQFPLRDTFRSLKALVHRYALGQQDTNGIYLSQGHAAQQEYPLDEASVAHALSRFQYLHDRYLSDNRVVLAVVPDKGYYLAQESGQLRMDYEAMFAAFRLPWAQTVDLTDLLTLDSYYRTDTHWRQEMLIPVAQRLCEALGAEAPVMEDYTFTTLVEPFYGVYAGQAALPMEPDALTLLESPVLSDCAVYLWETGKTAAVYDLTRLEGDDLYEVFLSGPRSLVTVENPNALSDRELVIFRDSFGSALAPLLVREYAKVTLVDIRYIQIDLLERYVNFEDADILFLYSTLVLNNSETIK